MSTAENMTLAITV